MPASPKLALHGSVHFVTTTIEQGLPLSANPLIKLILRSCLARAQFLHPISIIAILVEANHLHMITKLHNPDDLKGFMERFKTESAHAINRIIGHSKRTVWCAGYDSPILLDDEIVAQKIAYLFANPAKDNLEDSIEKFPGLNSWKNFCTGKTQSIACKYISRKQIPEKLDLYQVPEVFKQITSRLKNKIKKTHRLTLEPQAWMTHMSQEQRTDWIKEIISRVHQIESAARQERLKQGKRVLGAVQLVSRPIDMPYKSTRSGRKSMFLSSDSEIRKEFAIHIRYLRQQAREVHNKWKRGDFSVPYPLGLYPPCLPKLAEPIGL